MRPFPFCGSINRQSEQLPLDHAYHAETCSFMTLHKRKTGHIKCEIYTEIAPVRSSSPDSLAGVCVIPSMRP